MDFSNKKKNKKERHFFHDVVNQTHSLNLFLSHKLEKKELLSIEDIQMMKDEIEIMQALIVDHFELKHKNVETYDEYDELIKVEGTINSLCGSYLDDSEISILGAGKLMIPLFIDLPKFHRIFTNLIKNIAEANASWIKIEFTVDSNLLKIKVKNDFVAQDRTIDSDVVSGVGLESVHLLVEELEGSFSSFVDESEKVWHCFTTIPIHDQKSYKKIA